MMINFLRYYGAIAHTQARSRQKKFVAIFGYSIPYRIYTSPDVPSDALGRLMLEAADVFHNGTQGLL